jgi:hypothetical protein
LTHPVLAERADIVRLDASLEKTLQGRGTIITHADTQAFKAAVSAAVLYGQWRSRYGAEGFDLLERSVGKLA